MSKEETSKIVEALGSGLQAGVTKLFDVVTMTHWTIKDSSSNTYLSLEKIMAIKEQNHV